MTEPRKPLSEIPAGEAIVEAYTACWRQSSSAPKAADWLASVPSDAQTTSIVLDLVYEEVHRRYPEDGPPDIEQYAREFGRFAGPVNQFVQMQRHVARARVDLAALAAPVRWPQIGQQVEGVELVREIGRGGFSRVFLGRDLDLGSKWVVLKLTPLDRHEAEVLGQIHDPQVAPIRWVQHDVDRGWSAVCLEYVGETTLADVLFTRRTAERPHSAQVVVEAIGRRLALAGELLPDRARQVSTSSWASYEDAIADLTAQTASGLAAAHELGIWHRDIKPSNVVLGGDLRCSLIDFNLSTNPQSPRNRLGGTLPYMAPEQLQAIAENTADASSAAADLFACGVMLYELLTGVLPFAEHAEEGASLASRASHLRARQEAGYLAVQTLNPRVDSRVAAWVDRCLALDPARRPSSARELADGLQALVRRVSTEHASRLRRRGWPAAVAAAAALAVGASFWLNARGPEFVPQRLHAAQQAMSARQWDQAIEQLDAALSHNRKDAAVWQQRGLANIGKELFELAIDDFEQAQKCAPSPVNLASKGFCLVRTDAHLSAVKWLQQAEREGLEHPLVYNNLAYSLLKLGRLDEAQAVLDKIPRDPVGSPATLSLRAEMALRRLDSTDRQLQAAVDEVDEAIRRGGDHADLRLLAVRLVGRVDAPSEDLLRRAGEHLRQARMLGVAEPLIANIRRIERIPQVPLAGVPQPPRVGAPGRYWPLISPGELLGANPALVASRKP